MNERPTLGRRPFLGLLGLGGLGLAVGTVGLSGCSAAGGPFGALRGPGMVLPSELPLPQQFRVPLPRVPVAVPVRSDAGTDHYEFVQRAAPVEIVPGTRTTIWGYDGMFPGPTIEARSGRTVVLSVRNELPVPTSTHLHGGVTPPDSDGYPTDLVVPAGFTRPPASGMAGMRVAESAWTRHELTKDYVYPLPQRAMSLWFHDHRMDFSAPQVWRGLLGSFVVRDSAEDRLPLPKGDKEISLLICDRSFAADGSFRYPSTDPTLTMQGGVQEQYMDGVLGDVILVNGAPWPVLEVANTRYRLRLLNASNARRYRLALDPPPAGATPFTQIGSDNGLLAAPQALTAVPIAPAERFDVVVDFAHYPVGTEITLVNELGEGPAAQVMRFRVTRAEPETSTIPAVLGGLERLDRAQAVAVRNFDFRSAPEGSAVSWTVNGQGFDPAASLADPALGTVELWRISSDFHHSVHTHLAHFQVLSRDGHTPEAADTGWKDTVDLRPYEVVELLIKFSGYRGRYLLHCHNLEHEDMAMMVNFTVT